MAFVLPQSPRRYGVPRTRWRLQDVAQALRWLAGHSVAGIYKVLKRLGFSRKRAERFIHSPDPDYQHKWRQVLHAYQDAVCHPTEAVLLFADELTYYRRPTLRAVWHRRGRSRRRLPYTPGGNTRARLAVALDAVTGRVLYRQRATIGRHQLAAFYAQLRRAYPTIARLYLVQDNWPVHKSPLVLNAAHQQHLRLLFLPTYASWLNPVEKLFRQLRQDILHNHELGQQFMRLRGHVEQWLDQFAGGSTYLLWLVGLLSKEEYLQNAS